MPEVSELLEKALSLPPETRAVLAGSLLKSLDDHVVLSRLPSWSKYLAKGPVASSTFMDNVEDLPASGRKRQC
jgi:hypothetical protein